jgi:hypothetical protein
MSSTSLDRIFKNPIHLESRCAGFWISSPAASRDFFLRKHAFLRHCAGIRIYAGDPAKLYVLPARTGRPRFPFRESWSPQFDLQARIGLPDLADHSLALGNGQARRRPNRAQSKFLVVSGSGPKTRPRAGQKAMARVGIEPTTPRFSASSAAFERLRLSHFSPLIRGFRHFSHPRFSAVFGRRVDLVLTQRRVPASAPRLSKSEMLAPRGIADEAI